MRKQHACIAFSCATNSPRPSPRPFDPRYPLSTCPYTSTSLQLGHQAANCPNGTINWRQIYGDDAFILRQPVYYSDIAAREAVKEAGMKDLEARAQAYAKVQKM